MVGPAVLPWGDDGSVWEGAEDIAQGAEVGDEMFAIPAYPAHGLSGHHPGLSIVWLVANSFF